MRNIEKIKINQNATIKKALKVIAGGNIKIATVVDKKDKLIGTITDGDIRRGFLKGLNINSSIKSIINNKPITGKKNDSKEKLLNIALSREVNQIPIINNKKKLIGIYLIEELIKNKI